MSNRRRRRAELTENGRRHLSSPSSVRRTARWCHQRRASLTLVYRSRFKVPVLLRPDTVPPLHVEYVPFDPATHWDSGQRLSGPLADQSRRGFSSKLG